MRVIPSHNPREPKHPLPYADKHLIRTPHFILAWRAASTRKRLWLGAGGVAVFVFTFVAWDTVARLTDHSHQLSLGHDFLPVYAAGELIREGRSAELYAVDPMAAIERRVAAEADLEPDSLYGPFLNPPFFALAYVPFAALPYRQAALAWLVLNFALIAGSVVLLCRMLPDHADRKTKGLVPLLLVLPIPFWQAMCHQQNTFLSLFLLCGVVTLWRNASKTASRNKTASRKKIGSGAIYLPGGDQSWWYSLAAGLLAGLLFYKPQLAVVVSVVMVTTLGTPALLGLAVAGATVLLVTVLAMPASLSEYLHRLPPVIYWMQQQLGYNWGRQVTPQAFWRVLLQGHVRGPTLLLPKILSTSCTLVAAVALVLSVWRYRRGRGGSLDGLIAAAIAAMPLLMPYYMDYDLLLLAVPTTLFAREWLQSTAPPTQLDRWQLALWVALFLGLYAGPGTASHTRLHPSVILISLVAGAALVRCFKTTAEESLHQPAHEPLRTAA